MSDEDVMPPPNITHLAQLQGNVHLIEAHHMQTDEMKNVRQIKWHCWCGKRADAISPFIALQWAAMGNHNTLRLPCLWWALSFKWFHCSIVLSMIKGTVCLSHSQTKKLFLSKKDKQMMMTIWNTVWQWSEWWSCYVFISQVHLWHNID